MAVRTFIEVEPSGRVKHQVQSDITDDRIPSAWVEITDPQLTSRDLLDWHYDAGTLTEPEVQIRVDPVLEALARIEDKVSTKAAATNRTGGQ